MDKMRRIIRVARGSEPADLVLKNCRIVNVFSGKIERGNIAIAEKKIAGIGDYSRAVKVIDIEGAYVMPGFIDAHVHIESSMVTPFEFSRAVLPLGTTSAVVDPHEIANVMGQDGIRFMLESSKKNHISLYFMLPSCVPASPFETSGATLSAVDLQPFLREKWVRGLGEVMNFPGVLSEDADLLQKIVAAKMKRVDGHAPSLTGKDLNAYISVGISSDHECVTCKEAKEKLARGMRIMIREGSGAKNLETLLRLVNRDNCHRFLLCTDDRSAIDLARGQHLNYSIKRAIQLGLDPIVAIKMATINVAEHYKIDGKAAVAPGYWADLAIVDNFKHFNIRYVLRSGKVVAENGVFKTRAKERHTLKLRGAVNVGVFSGKKLQVKHTGAAIKVIKLVKNELITTKGIYEPRHVDKDNHILPDIGRDVLKIAVVERHLASGNVGVGFVKGFGLKRGAIASTVAHDSHNIIVVGTNDRDMIAAIKLLIDTQGGQVVVEAGKPLALLPLPIAGLMSDQDVSTVAQQKEKLHGAIREIGCDIDSPFMALSFLALPVIPKLKISDLGLVDVDQFALTSLYVDSK